MPLQSKLRDSGFDGLVWQAGKGNPVGTSNFMMVNTGEDYAWVWIDLESGVPALFALNPVTTFRYYIPKSIKHKNFLFDDVDIDKLSEYIDRHKDSLDNDTYHELLHELNKLESSQTEWKNIPRLKRSLLYAWSQGKNFRSAERVLRVSPISLAVCEFWISCYVVTEKDLCVAITRDSNDFLF